MWWVGFLLNTLHCCSFRSVTRGNFSKNRDGSVLRSVLFSFPRYFLYTTEKKRGLDRYTIEHTTKPHKRSAKLQNVPNPVGQNLVRNYIETSQQFYLKYVGGIPQVTSNSSPTFCATFLNREKAANIGKKEQKGVKTQQKCIFIKSKVLEAEVWKHAHKRKLFSYTYLTTDWGFQIL